MALNNLQKQSFKDIQDNEIYQTELVNEVINVTENLYFSQSKFNKISFEHAELGALEFTKCVLIGCDWSNLDLSKARFYDCDFTQCKFFGTNFIGAYFKTTQFNHTNLNYANFSDSTLKQVTFENCELIESLFQTCTFSKIEFRHTNINLANFWGTNLKGIDFSNTEFDAIEVTLDQLNGIQINALQAGVFARLLGIKII